MTKPNRIRKKRESRLGVTTPLNIPEGYRGYDNMSKVKPVVEPGWNGLTPCEMTMRRIKADISQRLFSAGLDARLA